MQTEVVAAVNELYDITAVIAAGRATVWINGEQRADADYGGTAFPTAIDRVRVRSNGRRAREEERGQGERRGAVEIKRERREAEIIWSCLLPALPGTILSRRFNRQACRERHQRPDTTLEPFHLRSITTPATGAARQTPCPWVHSFLSSKTGRGWESRWNHRGVYLQQYRGWIVHWIVH